jgi:hypothetical protein
MQDTETTQSEEYTYPQTTFKKNIVFVVMPFEGEDMPYVYRAIKDECRKLKLNAIRVDDKVGSGLIIKDILTLIEQAEFLICDLTQERPNVYYELGYAHAAGNLGSNILLLAKQGTTLHFDISPLRVHFYRNPSHVRYFISSVFKQMIRQRRAENK